MLKETYAEHGLTLDRICTYFIVDFKIRHTEEKLPCWSLHDVNSICHSLIKLDNPSLFRKHTLTPTSTLLQILLQILFLDEKDTANHLTGGNISLKKSNQLHRYDIPLE